MLFGKNFSKFTGVTWTRTCSRTLFVGKCVSETLLQLFSVKTFGSSTKENFVQETMLSTGASEIQREKTKSCCKRQSTSFGTKEIILTAPSMWNKIFDKMSVMINVGDISQTYFSGVGDDFEKHVTIFNISSLYRIEIFKFWSHLS